MLSEQENARLFTLDDAASLTELQTRLGVTQRVNALPAALFTATTDDELARLITEELTAEPLRLHVDQRKRLHVREVAVSPSGTAWDLLEFALGGFTPGLRVRYGVPYSGLGNLWRMRPHRAWDVVPRANVVEATRTSGRLEFVVLGRGEQPMAEIDQALEEELQKIAACIAEQTPYIEAANAELPARALEEVQKRRRRLDLVAAVTADVTPEPPPLQNETAAEAPGESISLPPLPPPQQFPRIDADTFEAILGPIRALGLQLQQYPRVVIPLGEDPIRDLFVVQLNAVFGATTATGETFRGGGRTDIRVGALNASAFVAECKLWDGPSYSVTKAIDQILRDTTPIDRHCALLIFNKEVHLDTLGAAIPKALAEHPRRTSPVESVGEREWRMNVAREGEMSAEITLHIFAFHFVMHPDKS